MRTQETSPSYFLILCIAGGVLGGCELFRKDEPVPGCDANGNADQHNPHCTSPEPSPTPSATPSPSTLTIAAAGTSTCAKLTDDSVKCWGEIAGLSGMPTLMQNLVGSVDSIRMSPSSVCALLDDDTALCVSSPSGSASAGGAPSGISDLSGNIYAHGSPASQYSLYCALASGGMGCWGYNGNGQFGDGTNSSSNTYVSVSGLPTGSIDAMDTGNTHSCAVVSGAAYCWGINTSGGLGDGTNAASYNPVAVTGLVSGVTAIAAEAGATCAIHNGAAKCWGSGGSGRLGNGSTSDSSIPVQVSGLTSGVTAIAVGVSYACAIQNGAAKCWGANYARQLGDGTTTDRSTPITVTGLTSGIEQLVAGEQHACIVNTDGSVKCWGNGSVGQLGAGGSGYDFNRVSAVPVDVLSLN